MIFLYLLKRYFCFFFPGNWPEKNWYVNFQSNFSIFPREIAFFHYNIYDNVFTSLKMSKIAYFRDLECIIKTCPSLITFYTCTIRTSNSSRVWTLENVSSVDFQRRQSFKITFTHSFMNTNASACFPTRTNIDTIDSGTKFCDRKSPTIIHNTCAQIQ